MTIPNREKGAAKTARNPVKIVPQSPERSAAQTLMDPGALIEQPGVL